MPSAVGICNIALGWLGANRITSLSDATTEANLCLDNYETSRDFTLESRNWSFALSRAQLNQLATPPAFEFSYAYGKPSKCLRIIRCSADGTFEDDVNWVLETEGVLCDYDSMYCKFIKRITDTTFFSGAFVQALAARIAADICIPLTHSKDMYTRLEKLFDYKLDIAGALDGMQGKNVQLRSNELVNVR